MDDFFKKYNINDEVIAAGVSGGADSLALIFRLEEWAKANNRKVVALTVDHGLRVESGQEALYVADLMKQYGIEHHILVWEGSKPTKGIEAEARAVRYQLLGKWCQENQVKVLATGHHQRDQAETFLLRLQRGSGLSGLSGILPVSNRDGLMIIRPQLENTPQELKDFLIAKGIAWVEDPSNQCEDFQRVKIRNYLPQLEKEIGISVECLAGTADVLARTRAYMEEQVEQVVRDNVRYLEKNCGAIVSKKSLDEMHEEIRYRLLALLIKKIGKRDYTPEAEDVLRLCRGIVSEQEFRGCTLGECEIFAAQKKIWIVPELKSKWILSKKMWEEFVVQNPQYGHMMLPYKVRRVLFERLAEV